MAAGRPTWLRQQRAPSLGAGSAEAEIHYSGNVHVHLVGDDRATLPLSNGAYLVFENYFGSTFVQTFTFVIKGAVSGSARGVRYGPGRVALSNLGPRNNVSAGRFDSVPGHARPGVLFIHWSDGQFSAPADGFVGFRFNTGNGTQYGWVRIKTETGFIGNYHVHDLIKDYAWGDPELGCRFPRSPGFWRTRLGRLARATPGEARLTRRTRRH